MQLQIDEDSQEEQRKFLLFIRLVELSQSILNKYNSLLTYGHFEYIIKQEIKVVVSKETIEEELLQKLKELKELKQKWTALLRQKKI